MTSTKKAMRSGSWPELLDQTKEDAGKGFILVGAEGPARFCWKNLSRGLARELARAAGVRVSLPAEDLAAKFGEPPTDQLVRDIWPTLRDRWLASRPTFRRRVLAELRAAGLGDASVKVDTKTGQMEYLRSCRQSDRLKQIVLNAFLDEGSKSMIAPPVKPDQPPPPNAAQEIAKLLSAAQGGDVDSQYQLATHHREGNGPVDLSESLKWYRKAAEAGHIDAMNDLGSMLLNGLGCEVDRAEAMKWYEAAAELGHPVACYNVAKRYLHDVADLEQAFHWFSEAARGGYTAAFCDLGTMFSLGHGTERNLVAAANFHLIAAKEGDVVAIANISDYLDELQGVALRGDATASRCLSEIYNLGLGAQKSMPLTWAWTKWAKEGCAPSDDADEAAGIAGAYEFYKSCLTAEDREEGERALKDLVAAAGKGDGRRKPPANGRRSKT